MEREVSYYINIGRDSARAEQSAKDWAVEVRQRERPSTRQLQDGVEGNVWEMSCRTCDNVCVRVKESGSMRVCVCVYVCVCECVWQLPKAASERECEEEYREVHYGLNHWSLPPKGAGDCPPPPLTHTHTRRHTYTNILYVYTFTAHPCRRADTVCMYSTLFLHCWS